MSQIRMNGVRVENPTEDSVRVGVLSFHSSKETKAILNAIAALGHDPVWLSEENTRMWIEDGSLCFDPDVDVVVNRLLCTKMSQPLDDLGVAASYAVYRPTLNRPEAVFRAMHKYTASTILSATGVPVPDSYLAFSRRNLSGCPFSRSGRSVHKPIIGTNGAGMSVVDPSELVDNRIDGRRAFVQEYLPPSTERLFDVRVYVVDDEIIGAMKRYAPVDEWRTNVSLGGDIEGITEELSPETNALARRAASALDLDYAGVDLLFSGDQWYVLEVNATAGFKGFFKATGINPAPYIARLAIERAGSRVDGIRFTELTKEFDSSDPRIASNIRSEEIRESHRRRDRLTDKQNGRIRVSHSRRRLERRFRNGDGYRRSGSISIDM